MRDEHDEEEWLDTWRPRVPPGKVTLTSRLNVPGPTAQAAEPPEGASSSRDGASVQRKALPDAGTRADMARWETAASLGYDSEADMQASGVPVGDTANDLPGHGGGKAMPDDVRATMEAAFGVNFSAVRIHEGSNAQSIGALAYTQGTDIHFAPGQYQPESQGGRQLLGHELAHVVQQMQGRVRATTQARGVAVNDDESLEREADEMGARAARGERMAVPGVSRSRSDAPDAHQDPTPALPVSSEVEEGRARGGHVASSSSGSGSGSGYVQAITPSSSVAQLDGEYAQFPEALENILSVTDETPGPGSQGHPGTYREHVPASCYTTLWDIFKALHWTDSFGRSAAAWARTGIQGMRNLQAELTANGVLGAPLVSRVSTVLAPILNPSSGSAAGSDMQGVFAATVDSHRRVGPVERSAQRWVTYAETSKNVMVAAANILSPDLSADVPLQILNASTPYNYLFHRAQGSITGGYLNGVTALYRARWEATRMSVRREKITYARNAFGRLLSERDQRQMLQAITSLDEAGVETQLAALRAGIQTHVLSRMDAVASDSALTPIARNGQAIPERARPSGGGGGRRRAAEPIVYEDGAEVTAWSPDATTTNITAREELGDDPRRTLHGANIGPYSGGGYACVYNAREYKIVVRTGGRPYFGIKYGGRSSMTLNAINDLLARDYFTDTQRMVMRAAIPQVSSEGGISSINTWDKQDLTIAGRGERSGRVTLLVDAARVLMAQYEPDVDVSQLDEVQRLVTHLAQRSEEGTAGPGGVRFDLPSIHSLVELLETPAIHRAMTFAKINDSLLGFFSASYSTRGGRATRYDQDLDRGDEERLDHEVGTNHLHPAIMGVAMHHRLGAPAYFSNPMAYSIQANNAFPQRAAYTAAGLPDYEQLSKQVAYLGKIRIQNWRNRTRGDLTIATATLNAIFSQKVADFNNYFTSNGITPENGAHFNYAAATSVLSFWTGPRQFQGSSTQPAEGRLYFNQGSGRSRTYFDCGPSIGGEAASPAADVDEGAEED